ncbi:MAG: hypothetical protein KAT90_04565 [Gammaproteobacteria bacterium]|nr:hypothetical protein [Gammaproteobacteria bacterium]
MSDTGKAFVPQSQDDDDSGKEIQRYYTVGAAHVASGVTGSQVTPRDSTDSANQTFVELGGVAATLGFCRVVINPSTDSAAAAALHTGVGALHFLPGEILPIRASEDVTNVYIIAFGANTETAVTGLVRLADSEATVLANQVRWRFTGSSDNVRHVNIGSVVDAYAAVSPQGLFVEGFKS